MENKEYVKNELEKKGYKLGCYDTKINELNKKKIDFILSNTDTCDKAICINRKYYIVEICCIDTENKTEIDFSIVDIKKYIEHYGTEILESDKLENLKYEYRKFMKN